MDRFNKTKLLIPGWPGELARLELGYIKSSLKHSASLRRRWGFRPSARRFSEEHIREVARNGYQKYQRRVLASVGKGKIADLMGFSSDSVLVFLPSYKSGLLKSSQCCSRVLLDINSIPPALNTVEGSDN